ncbi:MAG: bifunctional demethylmenaquinone methyltransferase/2-methoxy-6-polyprenyl-1,4-benzoquinol methylase UbiE [Bacteroidales bacterium]|nr:bifunctional demethylmenaquinone methyltransferase/2-methoxy-6-polyprenyl-1,4-benzoquinol methylase UbiE [Bacteroidales bacterium]
MPSKKIIEGMFDSIAKDYDSLNHIMSLSIDKIWRRKAIRKIQDAGDSPRVLDVACGTGDFSIAIAKAIGNSRIIGVDISKEMLEVMRGKVLKNNLESIISQEVGDGEDLRFPENSFDRVVNAFGIRNFEDRDKGLREALRVLRPGGRLVILELSRPRNWVIRWFYDLYFMNILPKIGGKVSGDKKAYLYLPASVKAFPGKKEFMERMRGAGFVNITHRALTLGICRMYCGDKPE